MYIAITDLKYIYGELEALLLSVMYSAASLVVCISNFAAGTDVPIPTIPFWVIIVFHQLNAELLASLLLKDNISTIHIVYLILLLVHDDQIDNLNCNRVLTNNHLHEYVILSGTISTKTNITTCYIKKCCCSTNTNVYIACYCGNTTNH